MASELRVNTLKDASGNNSTAMSTINQGTAKAWVQATDAAALTDSFNISGGTDNGTGDYTYTLSNNMANNQWSQTCNAIAAEIAQIKNTTLLTSALSVTVFARADSFTAADQRNFVALHGDLA